MALTVEKIDCSTLIGRADLTNGVEEFNMEVTYPYTHTRFFTEEQFQADRTRLESRSQKLRTFLIGAFTGSLDPKLKRLPYQYSGFIVGLHLFYLRTGVEPYSCMVREEFGQLGIDNEHTTTLDKLALDTSDFLTILPGASESKGTWKEIAYATQKGTTLVCLYQEANPEMEFRQRIMESAAVHGGRSELTFVTFGTRGELFSGLTNVVKDLRQKKDLVIAQ